MQIIKPEQQKVMSLAMIGKTVEEISSFSEMPVEKVRDILKEPSIKAMMQDVEMSDLSNKLAISRLKGATNLIDKIISGAQQIVDSISPEKWNKNHVTLFQMILREQEKFDKRILDEIQQRINITNNTQINVYTDTQGLEGVLVKLPAKAQECFWKEIIDLGKKYAEEYARAGQTTGEVIDLPKHLLD